MGIKNYFERNFLSDLKAGFITSIVALPLAIAFAIASGVPPVMGIYTAIIAGILGSSIGGSKYSITGPTGAMTVVVLSTLNKYGIEGLLLAGFLAGIIQVLFGLIKIGKFVKFIPLPVIIGFTAGIGAIIFIGQIGNSLGLSIQAKEHIWEIFIALFGNLNTINFSALLVTALTVLVLVFGPEILKKNNFTKNIPPSIIALIVSSVLAWAIALEIPLVGAIPNGIPKISFINFNFELIKKVLPFSFTIAMLGSIEALLCAVVCDGMSGTKHKSNKELVSQGINNMVIPFFGGIPSTAAIARSAVNIREGAKTRVSGIIHGLFLLLILLFFADLAYYIPKSFLAGVLMVVSFKMINFHELKIIINNGKLELIVFAVTFLLTIFTNLVFAVQIGMLLAVALLFVTLTKIINIKNMEEYDSRGEINSSINSDPILKDKVSVYTIHGPFFFGAVNVFEQKIEEHMHIKKPIIIIRMKHVPFIDSTAQAQLLGFLKKRQKNNSRVIFTEFWPGVRESLHRNREFKKLISNKNIFKTVNHALKEIRKEEKCKTNKKN